MACRSPWGRIVAAALSCLLGLALLPGDLSGTAVQAQEKEKAAPPAAAAPSADGNQPKPVAQRKNYLVWLAEANGLVFNIVFLAISFWFVAMVVQHLMTLRRDVILPLQLVEAFESHLEEKKYQEAYELAKADESFLGQVLSAGLAKLSTGYEKAVEAMQETGAEEVMKLEHRLSGISVVAVISPLVGLLGTVVGMIQAFQNLAESDAAPKTQVLAMNIGMALVTTFLGLVIAIPALMVHNSFKNRIARLVHEVGVVSDGLMSRFAGKKPATP